MGCEVTFHDKVGRERLTGAADPLDPTQLNDLLASAVSETVRAGEIARIGPAEVLERYGVEPRQVPDFIALRGDPSDKLPGARGVGPKGCSEAAAPARHARTGAQSWQAAGAGG